jgi:1-acyl-sn-glycerol-3-phosphate acyltransferase
MSFARGGRLLERLAGGTGASAAPRETEADRRLGGGRVPRRWPTQHAGADPWSEPGLGASGDQAWLRDPGPSVVREALQQGLLFPAARFLAAPRVRGADDLLHAPQPAVLAPNHSSDLDTPLILAALPRAWRSRTLVGAASDRFYRTRLYAVATSLWINTFPFDRGGDLRGLAAAAELLRDGHNVLLYPQGTRSGASLEGFRVGAARLCLATGAPIVPIHVAGTALIMPKDRGLIQRGRATVSFGRPLYPSPDEEPVELMRRTREAIEALGAR